MKIHMTKYELLAITAHLVSLPSPNPEHGRRRLRAWDALGVSQLADDLALDAAFPGSAGDLTAWRDRTAPQCVDPDADIVEYLIVGLSANPAGRWADACTRVRERLVLAKEGKYEAPV